MKGIKGRKAYNNGQSVIYLTDNDEIPEGFIRGGLSNRTPEQIKQIAEKSRNTQKKNWQEKSDDEKLDWSNKCKIAQSNLTEETKKQKHKKLLETLNNRSEEERQLVKERQSSGNKQAWSKFSKDERKVLAKKIIDNGGGWNKTTIHNTLKTKYNIDNISQLQDTKLKSKESIMKSNFDKYGFYWNCQLPQCMASIGGKGSNTKPNLEFAQLLDENNISYEREFALKNKSYDFKVNNYLIEIDPFATHNSTWSLFDKTKGLDKYYHQNKSQLAIQYGYSCIHVFDWDDKLKIISLLKTRETLYARNCIVKEVSRKDSIEYINKYHLQNYAKDTIRLGLYNNNELVSIMTFSKARYNTNYEYELVRYCANKNVIGGAEKLFKYFINAYNPNSIISYCDLSKFTGKVYAKLGFTLKNTQVSKHWYNPKTNQHILDSLLLKLGYDKLFHTNFGKGTSNAQLMLENGFVEIYDAGQASYIWLKNYQ